MMVLCHVDRAGSPSKTANKSQYKDNMKTAMHVNCLSNLCTGPVRPSLRPKCLDSLNKRRGNNSEQPDPRCKNAMPKGSTVDSKQAQAPLMFHAWAKKKTKTEMGGIVHKTPARAWHKKTKQTSSKQ